ncbi:substrate-specific activator of APC-dependent proteolysis [Malassezia sp. CBS 17886]|nr:substrate-specific activator of APC-dependent proteolysis [Malassezia sp. CBS 17886]
MYHTEFARRLRNQSSADERRGAASPQAVREGGDSDAGALPAPGPSRSRSTPLVDDLHARARPRSSSSPRPFPEQPVTPRKARSKMAGNYNYGDRFIPSRDGTDIQAAYQLIADEPLTPGSRNKRKVGAETNAQTGACGCAACPDRAEEANETYAMLLSSELFGADNVTVSTTPSSHGALRHTSPSRGAALSPTSSTRAACVRGNADTHSLPVTPSKKNLLSFKSTSASTTPTRLRERRLQAAQLFPSGRARDTLRESMSADMLGAGSKSDADLYGGGMPTRGSWQGEGALFGGLSVSNSTSPSSTPSSLFSPREPIDSPAHTMYNTSPVKPESQRLLLSARKPARSVSSVPYKVLDAPELADDFYLNLVDWSNQDVLGVGLGKCAYLWSAKTSTVTKLCDLQGVQDSITGLNWSAMVRGARGAYSRQGNHLAIGTHSGLVQIWDVEKERLLRTMMGHTARVGALAWNNHVLTTGSRDRTIYHRDVRVPDQHVKTLLAHRQEVCGLKWNPSRDQLASGGNDNKLLVWDALSTTPLYRFSDHTAAVKAIAWSPHQQGLLASGGGTADMKIRFWNTQTGAALSAIDTGSQVCNLAWNRTSNEIVSTHGYSSGCVHNQIHLWRYPSLSQVATLTGHTMRVLYLAMSPSGRSIVTGAGDETLRFWDLNTPSREMLDRRDDRSVHASFVKLR